jgi:hypothetical protein
MTFHKPLFCQDKREAEGSLTLGLTMRGIQIFQVRIKWCWAGFTTENACVTPTKAQSSFPFCQHRGG